MANHLRVSWQEATLYITLEMQMKTAKELNDKVQEILKVLNNAEVGTKLE